ncbi:MAG: hypothetical protein M1833_004482 [Piccolia ochrophora]|nr:MAG: hypothetical protein M1833_004482 [Piccolia ochrophora]
MTIKSPPQDPSVTDGELQFDSIEDTIAAFKTGSFIIVLDSPHRENEGDLIIAASHLTPAKAAFMIHHTSGVLCAPLPASRAAALSLPAMVPSPLNRDPNRTAYTVSVDAALASVSTGISAHDRSVTARVLADPGVGAEALRRPGHVFPLVARDGGVRERSGHTEAAVEFCRLAGLEQVAVISELVQGGREVVGAAEREGEDGMMRAAECVEFARRWGLRVCTIEGLVGFLEGEGTGESGVNGVV